MKIVVFDPSRRTGALRDGMAVDLPDAFAKYAAENLDEAHPIALAGTLVPWDLARFIEGGPRTLENAEAALDYLFKEGQDRRGGSTGSGGQRGGSIGSAGRRKWPSVSPRSSRFTTPARSRRPPRRSSHWTRPGKRWPPCATARSTAAPCCICATRRRLGYQEVCAHTNAPPASIARSPAFSSG